MLYGLSGYIPVDTQRGFNVYKSLRRIDALDVEMTSYVYWGSSSFSNSWFTYEIILLIVDGKSAVNINDIQTQEANLNSRNCLWQSPKCSENTFYSTTYVLSDFVFR